MAFPTTRWTLIRQAALLPTEESRAALEELCTHYRAPVLQFIRNRVSGSEIAEDLTQEFFSKLIRGALLQRADQDRGQFRSFLLHAIRGFLIDARAQALAEKRGGAVHHVSISEPDGIDPEGPLSADREFDLQWARTVLSRSLDRLQQEHTGPRHPLFEALKDSLDGSRKVEGRQMAEQLGMSEGAMRVALHRMRIRLGQIIREEVADTVPSGSDIDEEIRALRKVLETGR